MKAQTKLAIGMVIAIIAVLIASQSSTRTIEIHQSKQDGTKIKQSEGFGKVKLKTKQEAIRDLSTGSENIR